MKKPKISIITVCYNASNLIEQTIRSVLSQTYSNIEFIIIDGGSTDGTIDIIKEYSCRISKWVSEQDKGIYDAMNKGATMASGEWIIYRNVGDFFVSKTVVEDMFRHNIDDAVTILHGDCRYICDMGEKVFTPGIINPYYDKTSMPVFHPSTFIRAEYQRQNPYDISLRSSADFDFFLNALLLGKKFEYRPILVADYSFGDGMSVKNWYTVLRENNIILEKYGLKKYSKTNYYYEICNTYIHNIIKSLLPKCIVFRLQKRNLQKEGWKLY